MKTSWISSPYLVSNFYLIFLLNLTILLSDPKQKLEQLKELDMTHLKQLIKSDDNTKEIEDLLTSYNEMVQQISSQIEYLDIITA